LKLFIYLQNNNVLSTEDFEKGFNGILENIEDIDLDIPFASKFCGSLIGNMIALDNSLGLFFLEDALRHLAASGKAANIAVTILQTLVSLKDQDSVVHMFKESKLDLSQLMKKENKSPEQLNEFLKQKDLEFLSQDLVSSETPKNSNEKTENNEEDAGDN